MNTVEIAFMLIVLAFIIYYFRRKTTENPPDSEKMSEDQPELPKHSEKSKFPDLAGCYKSKNLLTKTEYAFYGILKGKCDVAGLLICPKVRLEDFINVTAKERMKYRGYIKSRHVDFLICDSALHILAALELDDPSHLSEKAQQTDYFKDQLYDSIGLPLFRIPTGQDYPQKIDELIAALSIK